MSKRKQTALDLQTKIEIIEKINSGVKQCKIVEEYKIPKGTLSGIWKNREKIYDSVASGCVTPKSKRLRTAKHEDLEAELILWFKNTRDKNISLAGPAVKVQADKIADRLGIADFKFSDGWFARFKTRHNITSQKKCGEANKVSEQSAVEWLNNFKTVLEHYRPEDVWNFDESGIFFNLQPDRTLNVKGSQCHGGTNSKQRLTAAFCCNSNGTEKLTPWVIGKYENPRCFKGLDKSLLPCEYSHQKKAWVDGVSFRKWLLKFNSRMSAQNRQVLLTIDNCTAHNVDNLKLSHTKIFFFPPNFTSRLQPLDMGIIAVVKRKFRHRLVCACIEEINKGKEIPKWNVLDAIRNVRLAWDAVTPDHIKNCFRKAWTPKDEMASDNLEVIIDETPDAEWETLKSLCVIVSL